MVGSKILFTNSLALSSRQLKVMRGGPLGVFRPSDRFPMSFFVSQSLCKLSPSCIKWAVFASWITLMNLRVWLLQSWRCIIMASGGVLSRIPHVKNLLPRLSAELFLVSPKRGCLAAFTNRFFIEKVGVSDAHLEWNPRMMFASCSWSNSNASPLPSCLLKRSWDKRAVSR